MYKLLSGSEHTHLAERLFLTTAPFVAIFAPAGYGKSLLARNLASRFGRAAFVSVGPGSSQSELLAAVAAALSESKLPSSESVEMQQISRAWAGDGKDCALVIDAVDRLDDATLQSTLELLLQSRPENGRLVIASRREPNFNLTDVIEPHLVIVVRRAELAILLPGLRELAKIGGKLDDTAVAHIFALCQGWPLVALCLIRFAVDKELLYVRRSFDDRRWSEIYDWLEANVMRELPTELQDALLFCVACTDAEPGDFPEGSVDLIQRGLCRDYQLVDVGFAGKVRVLPFLRNFINARYQKRLRAIAESVVGRFLTQGDRVRAARVYVNVGFIAKAAAVLPEIDMNSIALSDYAFPAGALDAASATQSTYSLYPSIWYGLVGARQYVVPARQLVAEGENILASCPLETRERAEILRTVASLCAIAGDVDAAQRCVAELVAIAPDFDGAAIDAVHLLIDAFAGRYTSVVERWERSGYALSKHLTLYLPTLLIASRALNLVRGRPRAQEVLAEGWSLAKVTGSPFHAASVAAEAAYQAWFGNESAVFEVQRGRLLRILRYYEVPAYWSTAAAFIGFDYRGEVEFPDNAARAAIMRAVEEQDEARRGAHALRAIEISDARSPFLRVASRIAASYACAQDRGRLLQEAREIAEVAGEPALRQAVDGVAAGAEEVGALQRVVERLRTIPLSQKPVLDAGVSIDFTNQQVTRNGIALKLSDKSLALLILLAVHNVRVSREMLIDRLWPDVDADAASNALKMCVHRTRAQLSEPAAIIVEGGQYRLGEGVTANYFDLLAIGSDTPVLPLDAEERQRLSTIFERLISCKDSACWCTWDWFVPHLRALSDATRTIGERLVRDAIARRELTMALRLARSMTISDPFDELPRSLVIECYAAMKNLAMAQAEYRQYREIVKRELGVEPSAQLYALASG